MSELKPSESHLFKKHIKKTFSFYFFFGPDQGLIKERAKQLNDYFSQYLDDPMGSVKISGADLVNNPSMFMDELNSFGMFSTKKVIHLSSITEKDLSKNLTIFFHQSIEDCVVIIEAGDIKKSSELWKKVQASTSFLAIPCYADDARGLKSILDEELKQKGYEYDYECEALILSLIGSDRVISRNEVQKLALFKGEDKQISQKDVVSLLGDSSKNGIDELIDHMAIGHTKASLNVLSKLLHHHISPSAILTLTLLHFQRLEYFIAQTKLGQSPMALIRSARPLIFFTRHKNITDQIMKWSISDISQSLDLINETIKLMRLNPGLENTLLSRLVLNLSQMHKKPIQN